MMTTIEMNENEVARSIDHELKGIHILFLSDVSSEWISMLQKNGSTINHQPIGSSILEIISTNEVDLLIFESTEHNPLAIETVYAIQKSGQSIPMIALLENEDPQLNGIIPCLPRDGKPELILSDMHDALGRSIQITSMTRLQEIYKGNESIVRSALSVIKSNLENEITNYIAAVFSRSVSEIMYAAHRVRPIASLLGVNQLDGDLRYIEENAITLNSKELHALSLNSIRMLRKVQREVNTLYT